MRVPMQNPGSNIIHVPSVSTLNVVSLTLSIVSTVIIIGLALKQHKQTNLEIAQLKADADNDKKSGADGIAQAKGIASYNGIWKQAT